LYGVYETGEISCYDVRNDPYEQKNMATSLPEVLKKKLHSIVEEVKNCGARNGCWEVQLMDPGLD